MDLSEFTTAHWIPVWSRNDLLGFMRITSLDYDKEALTSGRAAGYREKVLPTSVSLLVIL